MRYPRRTAAAIALAAILAGPLAAQAPAASAPAGDERAEVLAVVNSFMEGLKNHDAAVLRSHIASNMRLTLLRPDSNGTRIIAMSGEEFITAVTTNPTPGFEEPIRNVEVRIDGQLASVWAEYQVTINGKLSHCGYDAFHLARMADGWKIVNTADSFRRDCGEKWIR